MNKRKLLTLAMTLCMVAILAIGGTLAYFSDYDSNVNVMTVGNLKIDQVEDWDEDGILAPGAAAIKKNVHVENNGTVPAYIRTFIAVEDTRDVSAGVHLVSGQNDYLTFYQNAAGTDFLQIQDADGVVYTVGVVEYPTAIPAGEQLSYALTSVQVKAEADNAWREIVGDEYNVIVMSQAVNAIETETAKEVLAAAFGKVDETVDDEVATWFNTAVPGKNFRGFDYSEYTAAGSTWGQLWKGEAYTNPTNDSSNNNDYSKVYTGRNTQED